MVDDQNNSLFPTSAEAGMAVGEPSADLDDPAVVDALEAAVRLGDAAKALLATKARTELARELRTVDVRLELNNELKAVDAKWRPEISKEAAAALKQELKAIDAKWRPEISKEARVALGKELKAIDAGWQPEIAKQAGEELARLAEQFLAVAQKCGQLSVIGTQAKPSTDLIGVVAQSVIAASNGQNPAV